MDGAEGAAQVGKFGVYVTDGGLHPPETLARMTLDQILEMGVSDTVERAEAAIQLRERWRGTLERAYQNLDAFNMAAVLDELGRAAMETPWAPAVFMHAAQIRAIIERDARTAIENQRQWRLRG